MPIIDQLVAANPHALHSLDPMAGVDIAEVKRLYGGAVALCGNVHCAAMQTGTIEEVTASAEYCLTHAKPGGGYVYCTSNIPFKGLPLERYLCLLYTSREAGVDYVILRMVNQERRVVATLQGEPGEALSYVDGDASSSQSVQYSVLPRHRRLYEMGRLVTGEESPAVDFSPRRQWGWLFR